jgi:hypothetical protein
MSLDWVIRFYFDCVRVFRGNLNLIKNNKALARLVEDEFWRAKKMESQTHNLIDTIFFKYHKYIMHNKHFKLLPSYYP